MTELLLSMFLLEALSKVGSSVLLSVGHVPNQAVLLWKVISIGGKII